MWHVRSQFLVLCVTTVIFCVSQEAKVEPQEPQARPSATVTFTFDWPSVQPSHYSISVDALGHAAYESRTAEVITDPSSPDVSYTVKFTVSDATRTRIFDLAKQANFFNGDFDFKKHRIANSGTKKLAYSEAGKHYETTYNWSENPAIQQLTSILGGIANTEEAGQKLEELRHYDKLGLNEELRRMEDLAKSHSLLEVQSILPVLQVIASDPAVMNIARQRAQHLLQLAKSETATVVRAR